VKKSIKRTHSADVANIFVRNLLCDISEVLGGFNENDRRKTLRYFHNCCAYTGCKLSDKTLTLDHLVPQNRANCGLHLYGNIVPASSQANKRKGSKGFEEFILTDSEILNGTDLKVRKDRIEKLKEFQKHSGYLEKFNTIANLEVFVQEKYQVIQELSNETFKEIKLKYLNEEFDDSFKLVLNSQLIDNEIDKLTRRIPLWLKKPDQFNSQILIRYLRTINGNEFIDLNVFKAICSDINGFDSNLAQMSKISKNNHGRVFELIGTNLYLWEPIKKFVFEEYEKSTLERSNE
jgi:hypothetical protein